MIVSSIDHDSSPSTIGLIIGHGYGKAWTHRAKTRFPAIAAPASAAGYEETATGHGPEQINLERAGNWLVGEDAQVFAPERVVSILDKSRYNDPSFVAMARYALDKVVGTTRLDHIMSGMPSAWFDDLTARQALEAALLEAARPWGIPSIKIAPEAAGVFYSYVFELGRMNVARTRGAIGVIDIGYRDANIALFNNGRYAVGRSVPGGMVAAFTTIKRLIAHTYGLELSEHEVDTAVQRGAVRIAGTDQPLPPGSKEEIEKGLSAILGAARSIWPSGGKTCEAIVLGGGGAVLLGPALRREFMQLVVDSDPQMAGVRGFAAAAAASVLVRR